MINSKASLLMFKNEEETEDLMNKYGDSIEDVGFNFQDLNGEETRPSFTKKGEFDASLEEVLHLITDYGYSKVYPEAFSTQSNSYLTDAMDIARGGKFDQVPDSYPQNAWYTYYDSSCNYSCQAVEYFYWGLTSILGGQDFEGRLDQIKTEWKLLSLIHI